MSSTTPATPAAPASRVPTFTRLTRTYSAVRSACAMLATVLFDFKAYGTHNIPSHGGVLIVANHQSFLDPALFAVRVKRPMSFMAKSQLFEPPVFGPLIRRLNAFPVNQQGSATGAIKETIKRLREGHVLIMFPEGGRSQSAQIEPMQRGVSLIVRQAGPEVKVVPAAIYGAFDAWSRHHKIPRPHPVCLKYGQPMSLSHLSADQILQIVDREIRRIYEELRNLDH